MELGRCQQQPPPAKRRAAEAFRHVGCFKKKRPDDVSKADNVSVQFQNACDKVDCTDPELSEAEEEYQTAAPGIHTQMVGSA
eukprot:3678080-Pyramimonas_sp.AAC.1